MARPNLALPWARQYDFLLRGLHQIGRAIISYENHGMPKMRLLRGSPPSRPPRSACIVHV
jgi:hypothetical protein